MSTYTRMNLTVFDKRLQGTVTHTQKSGPEFQFTPFKFSTKFPAFHIPGKLTINFETTDNIFSKNINLENSLHFIKSLTGEWLENLLFQYQQQLQAWKRKNPNYSEDLQPESFSSHSSSDSSSSVNFPVQPESANDTPIFSLPKRTQQSTYHYDRQSSEEKLSVENRAVKETDNKDECNLPDPLLALYCATHPTTSEISDQKLNEAIVKFQKYVNDLEKCGCPDEQDELCAKCKEHWVYVEEHLRIKCQLIHCPLWKLCVKKQRYEFCKKHGPEGLVLLSQNVDRIGTVQTDYYDFSRNIVFGGYERVYQVMLPREQKCEIVVKEEFSDKNAKLQNIAIMDGKSVKSNKDKPLGMIPKLDEKQFKLIRLLDHKNVIKIEECVLGQHRGGETPYLFVMPFINKRGLNEQFTGNRSSIVDYLWKIPNLRDKILQNYIHIMIDVYEGLKYFADNNIIHGDIKRSNILVEQSCNCPTVIECQCSSKCFTAKLADFDFIKLADLDLITQGRQNGTWAKLLPYMPGGTVGMQPPEAFFQNDHGDLLLTPKADIWSAAITMMHGFQGRVDKDDTALEMINEFCKDVSRGLHQCHEDCHEGIEMLKELNDSIKFDNGQDHHHVKNLQNIIKKFVGVEENMICQCHFQSGRHPVKMGNNKKMKVISPMANIMTSVHIAHTMPQRCLKRMPDMFQSKNSQQKAIEKVWEVIQSCLRFQPEERRTASEISSDLKLTYPL